MKNKVLISILVASVLANIALAYVVLSQRDVKVQNARLVQSHVFLESAQEYLLHVLMKHQADLKNLVRECKDMTNEQFEDGVRRKIVRLEMEMKNVEKRE